MSISKDKDRQYKYWIMPTAKAEDDDGRRRNVVFHGTTSGQKMAWLCFTDTQHSEYKIPLGKVEAVAEEEERVDWENILVPVVPARYTKYDSSLNLMRHNAEQLSQGYIYVFRDGYLWRELEVVERGKMRDVNLTIYQGFDTRPGTGEFDNRVLLPYKVNGEVPELQVCFSPTQWCWARINAMGGMDPADPRLEDNAIMPSSQQKKHAGQLRKNRMGPKIDLSSYHQQFNVKSGPIGVADECQSYHARLHHKKIVPILFLHDSLTMAFDYAKEYMAKLQELQQVIRESQNHIHYKSAVLAYHMLFDPEKNSEPVVTCYGMPTGERENIDELSDPRDELDGNYIREILSVEKRKKLRKELRKLKQRHIEWLRGNIFSGGKYQPVKNIIPSPEFFVDFNTALSDYFAKENEHYVDGFTAFMGVASFVQSDPCMFDQDMDLPTYDADRPEPNKDDGFIYISELMDGGHPLHDKLFPKKIDFDAYSENNPEYKLADEENDGSGTFRNAAFANFYTQDQEVEFLSQTARRVFQAGKQVVIDLLSVLKHQWQHAEKNKKKIVEEIMVRVTQAANDPLLKGVHLVVKGDSLKGKQIVDGKLRVMNSIKSTETNNLNGSQTSKTKKTISVYEILKGEDGELSKQKIAQHALEDIASFKGYNSPFTDTRWERIFVERISETEVRARASFVVMPETSNLTDFFHNPNGTQSENAQRLGKILKGANYTLPPIVVFFELWNVSAAFEGFHSHRSRFKKAAEFIDALLGMSHSIVEATEILAGEKRAKQIFGNTLFEKKVKIKFLGSSVRLLNVLGAAFAGLTAALALWDTIYYIRRSDYGAALGSMMLAAGAGALAFSTLRATTALRFFGPLGWVATVVIVLAVLAVAFWKDSELVTWAKFGPLSKNKTWRYTEEYQNYDLEKKDGKRVSGKQAYEALASLLMRPAISMSRGGNTYWIDGGIGGKYIQGVVAKAVVPAFEVGKGSVDIRVTRQHDSLGPDIMTGWSKQVPITPVRIVQTRDAKTNMVTQVEYHYRPQDKYYAGKRDNRFYAKANVTTSQNLRIPSIPPGTKSSKLNDSLLVDEDAPGWVYAETLDV